MAVASLIVHEARVGAGLSRKALALRAGVPTSTISRIEDGEMDPTVGMLERVLGATGGRLVLGTDGLPPHALARLADAWRVEREGERVDWTRIRAATDLLTRKPALIADAIAAPPRRSGSRRMDNLLAALAEELADRTGIDPPAWTRHVPPLTERWQSAGTPDTRKRQAAAAPPRFRARGIDLAASTVWRAQ